MDFRTIAPGSFGTDLNCFSCTQSSSESAPARITPDCARWRAEHDLVYRATVGDRGMALQYLLRLQSLPDSPRPDSPRWTGF
jgi:hypothetical protein